MSSTRVLPSLNSFCGIYKDSLFLVNLLLIEARGLRSGWSWEDEWRAAGVVVGGGHDWGGVLADGGPDTHEEAVK